MCVGPLCDFLLMLIIIFVFLTPPPTLADVNPSCPVLLSLMVPSLPPYSLMNPSLLLMLSMHVFLYQYTNPFYINIQIPFLPFPDRSPWSITLTPKPFPLCLYFVPLLHHVK